MWTFGRHHLGERQAGVDAVGHLGDVFEDQGWLTMASTTVYVHTVQPAADMSSHVTQCPTMSPRYLSLRIPVGCPNVLTASYQLPLLRLGWTGVKLSRDPALVLESGALRGSSTAGYRQLLRRLWHSD